MIVLIDWVEPLLMLSLPNTDDDFATFAAERELAFSKANAGWFTIAPMLEMLVEMNAARGCS